MSSYPTAEFDLFVDAVAEGQRRPQWKFTKDMLLGLLRGRSVLLSEIGRSLAEPCQLIHTEKRLSRNLGSDRFDDDRLLANYLDFIEPHLNDRRHRPPTIAVDTSDIQKSAGKKMPLLSPVRDGSNDRIGPGYELVTIEAAGDHGRRLPLVHRLFSKREAGFKTASEVVKKCIQGVKPHASPESFWVFDSGFDDNKMFEFLDDEELRWIVRLKLNSQRKLLHEGALEDLYALQSDVRFRKSFRCRKFTKNAKKSWVLHVGWTDVGLPARTRGGQLLEDVVANYTVVVVKGIGQEPMVLLTNQRVRSAELAEEIANSYMERWACEEAHRFVKQEFDLENIRVLSWRRLRRLVLLAMMAYGWLAHLVHKNRKRALEVARSIKAFGPPPVFLHYRLIAGVGTLLRRAFRRRAGPP